MQKPRITPAGLLKKIPYLDVPQPIWESDGAFSDLDMFTISDWFAHTPKDVLSANFGVPLSAFKDILKQEKYIYQVEVPGPLDETAVTSPFGTYSSAKFYTFIIGQEPL